MAELLKSIELQPITSQPPNYDLDVSSQHVSPGYPELPTIVPRQVTDYLPLSLFTMVYCCFPIGLFAFLYSMRVREANLLGDQTRAQRASRIVCVLNTLAITFGLITLLAVLLLVFLNPAGSDD
ncbi:synapse differentiation-inducing gene protein 1-like [Corticium candelabrum]|uniref:synapse differentiation-inducing gene protein 1-like n=1 Tax=Corticium candelabrum TaxID=121492 RepID=UPI002E2674D5|nr:synapse differentiation-inducing gene protein 1-like [Corticium candelabrum]